MNNEKEILYRHTWTEAIEPQRRGSHEINVGGIRMGGSGRVVVQTMTDCDTNDTEACLCQIERIRTAGCRLIRLTVQGMREVAGIGRVAEQVRRQWPDTALVADVHFQPKVADAVAEHVDKVRINPGNYCDRGGDFEALLEKCDAVGVALRIGVNHGSLSEKMVERYGDTPEGMVESAMEYLRVCRERGFANVAVSMKSSNTRVMVHAYRMLVAAMQAEGMDYPLHLGVTESGSDIEGRIKSAVGIGALMCDGVGDTIRVSLTEPPENEIPAAKVITEYFAGRNRTTSQNAKFFERHNPFSYERRRSAQVGRLGGGSEPLLYSELDTEELQMVRDGRIALLTSRGEDPISEWRAAIVEMDESDDNRPIILHREYCETDPTLLAIKAAADFGVMLIDGIADGIRLENRVGEQEPIAAETIREIELTILQGARSRMSKAEFIACPGCGRTLYSLQEALRAIKAKFSHLRGIKIGVMGCIVNGPGEMADADYGYVGAGVGRVTLYRGQEQVRSNIPQEEALDALTELIKADGKWIDVQQL